MATKSILRLIAERPLYRWIVVLYIALAFIAVTYLFFQSLTESRMRSEHELSMVGIYQQKVFARLDELEAQVQIFNNLLQEQEFDSESTRKHKEHYC